ncbi:O-methyltransferase [Agrobacterium pusense]|jgi:hypothetical protein|uniref:O-methyltransferase n=1 Tax=Agrobacterium pusense TaxID=648995 RepID=UPI0024530B00|nr:O-methyltransferase [Agrobacterium pusense]
MASFDSINYSLRPNKHIERSVVFENISRLTLCLGLKRQVYIGFGSVWFTDFQIAHRTLAIEDMRSMEKDPIGYARATFNVPFKTVKVLDKKSSDALPILRSDTAINARPWLIWLDYDAALSEDIIADIDYVIEHCPTNTMFLITFSANEKAYGKPRHRAKRLEALLGDVVPEDLADEDVNAQLAETLAQCVGDYMVAKAETIARPGGFLSAFNMVYTDTATMITVGGVLPAVGARSTAREMISSADWGGKVNGRIEAPHLTLREASMLQSQLPHPKALTRASIKKLGFDLRDEQIASFQKYYKYYPSFAQITV